MNINAIINDQLWKAVPGFPCFECHPTGLVRNAITGKIIAQSENCSSGNRKYDGRYMYCHMFDVNNKQKYLTVHRVIAMTFIDLPAIEDEYNWDVDHIDHDTTNNDVRNLRWLPASINRSLTRTTRPEVARKKIINYYREHDIDYDYFNLLSEI